YRCPTTLRGALPICTLKPWQMTFVIVGLPGVLWALLFIATVPEPPRREAAGAPTPGLRATLSHLFRHKDAFGPMFLANGIKAMLDRKSTRLNSSHVK